MNYCDFISAAANVVPSARQKKFLDNPFYAFVHFGVNTYTNREWGDGTEDERIFNPTDLNCDEWVRAIKSAGMSGMVLTAKHHDGFCLWQTKYTQHSVKNSPWRDGKGDVVREAAEACARGGIKFGVYLSPWDRNSKLYGTDEYNDYYKAQLTELLTQYGELFYVWFDGACGEGPNGRKQVYDFEGYIDLIRKYQPNACIFNDAGPDIRWIGNESGTSRVNEWMVVPSELCFRAEKQTRGALVEGGLKDIYNTWPELGSFEIIKYSDGLTFCPAETDMSIRPGWFYHADEEPHSLERLVKTYMTSVGGSATFNLNIPPMPSGRFDPRDILRLRQLGEYLNGAFGAEIPTVRNDTHIDLGGERGVRYIVLREDISKGQRVENFMLTRKNAFGNDEPFYFGTTIGNRRICDLGESVKLNAFDIRIVSARGETKNMEVKVY